MLAQVHRDLSPSECARRVEGNAPFERFPMFDPARIDAAKFYRRGVVLTHGLSDSPYFMRDLADVFQQQGFRVMAILLPGHGTQAGDLLTTRWQAWQKTLQFAVEKMADEAEDVYLAGLSAGAALSILQAYQDSRIKGLFLFSPALKISGRAAFASLHHLYSWLLPREKWLTIQPDADLYKYESFPKNAAMQMYALTQAVARLADQPLAIPIFAALSQQDKTVDSTAALKWLARLPHPDNQIIYYAAGAKLDVKILNKINVLDSFISGRKILSSAHTAIVLAPDNAHYGLAGSYRNCQHYFPHDLSRYQACQAGEAVAFGEITPENLQAGVLQRLMVNPQFESLRHSLKQFMASLAV
jgi:esterase/lipase